MAEVKIKGGDKVSKALREIAKKVSKASSVRVGFLENAKYPNGTPVAMAAAINNFGAPRASIPKRPFFSDMVREKAPSWPEAVKLNLKAANYDAKATLEIVGKGIEGQLREAIIATDSPPLSPITIMLRGMKSHDQNLVVTGRTVGEAARRVAEGKTNYGAQTKPLEDTKHMLMSVDSEVK